MNEDTAERQYSTHQHTGQRLGVQGLSRNLTGNLVRTNWSLDCGSFETEERSDKRKWNGNEKPKTEQSNQSSKWYSSRRAFRPKNRVGDKEHGEKDARNQSAGQDYVCLPIYAVIH